MKFKKILVSDDNQLVVGDYGLKESEVEIVDLNKSLHDVVEDLELAEFIKQNIVDSEKIYIFCVKENFGSNEQLLEDINDIKVVNKAINKTFKKFKNLYFFVYNTFMKSEGALNPTLEKPSSFTTKEAKVLNEQPVQEKAQSTQEDSNYTTFEDNVKNEEIEITNDIDLNKENVESNEVKDDQNVVEYFDTLDVQESAQPETQEENLEIYTQEEQEVHNEDMQIEDINQIVHGNEVQDVEIIEHDDDEVLNTQEDVSTQVYDESMLEVDGVKIYDKSITNLNGVEEENIIVHEEVSAEEIPAEEVTPELQEFIDGHMEASANLEQSNDGEIVEDVQEFVEKDDLGQLNDIFSDLDTIHSESDDRIRENMESEPADFEQEYATSEEIFDERNFGINEETQFANNGETVNFDSVDNVAVENQEVDGDQEHIVFNNKLDDSVDMPDSYFDVENENDITYEDYNEFVNDYELNVHTLKSIYDFIWRVLVLNNYNLKLNDLLYIAVNNLDAFSIGQSDFVRQTANKADSLFDLILQLDIKLEFNNSLFYIYLAQFFTISGNKIVVNEKFLDTLSIWVDKVSKQRFIEQIEQFMNYSSIYNKKIVFSYFIELANFIKGCLPTISPSITLVDIHRILTSPARRIRSENVFGFIVQKINQIFKENGIVPEMYLVDTPENIFGIEENLKLDETSDNWKTQLTILYKKLVENILNYILLKGNKESEIFNMYIDIKDLRMYRGSTVEKNILSPETLDALAKIPNQHPYATIGDAFNREASIVPSQTQEPVMSSTDYLNIIENGMTPNVPGFGNANIGMNNQYPENVVLGEQQPRTMEGLRSKYAARFNMSEFETSMSKRIEEYERKIKDNIARIEAERKQLRQKMEDLKNI